MQHLELIVLGLSRTTHKGRGQQSDNDKRTEWHSYLMELLGSHNSYLFIYWWAGEEGETVQATSVRRKYSIERAFAKVRPASFGTKVWAVSPRRPSTALGMDGGWPIHSRISRMSGV